MAMIRSHLSTETDSAIDEIVRIGNRNSVANAWEINRRLAKLSVPNFPQKAALLGEISR